MSREAAGRLLLEMLVAAGGNASLKYKDIKEWNEGLHDYLKKQNKRLVNELVHGAYISKLGNSCYGITEEGRAFLDR